MRQWAAIPDYWENQALGGERSVRDVIKIELKRGGVSIVLVTARAFASESLCNKSRVQAGKGISTFPYLDCIGG